MSSDTIWAVVMLPLCMSICPGLCSDDEERAKSRALSFWGIKFLSDSDVDVSAPRGRTLDGGTARSLGIKVPRGDSSGEAPRLFILKASCFLLRF